MIGACALPPNQGDSRLRLLNYQNNLIRKITNLANLPCLIFLDLYNNLIDTLDGPLSAMSSLRVLMVGKNKVEKVTVACGEDRAQECRGLRTEWCSGSLDSLSIFHPMPSSLIDAAITSPDSI